jgi:MFS transporter, PAT family, beta-lactamase induction signal transducer AmpG
MSTYKSRPSNLLLLTMLYIVQGLPYGFQAKALPILLRENGASLTIISLLSVLALPWMLKILWAPLVDRYHHPKWGKRRSWIIPLQIAMTVLAIVAGVAEQYDQWTVIFGLIFLMNCCAATQDIAVDGWAVELLDRKNLGLGNAAQVSGFKVGMLLSGGLLLYWSKDIGTAGIFYAMAAMIACCTLLVLGKEDTTAKSVEEKPRVKKIWLSLQQLFTTPTTRISVAIVLCYKMGETLNDTMFKPFLIDAGYSATELGLILGVWGMFFSVSGSIFGGILVKYVTFKNALWITGTLRIIPLFGQVWLSMQPQLDPNITNLVLYAEHFFGGSITTVVFALMMSLVNQQFAATHFTAFATIEVLGKVPFGLLSGWITDQGSYTVTFTIGTGLSVAFLILIPFLHCKSNHSPI